MTAWYFWMTDQRQCSRINRRMSLQRETSDKHPSAHRVVCCSVKLCCLFDHVWISQTAVDNKEETWRHWSTTTDPSESLQPLKMKVYSSDLNNDKEKNLSIIIVRKQEVKHLQQENATNSLIIIWVKRWSNGDAPILLHVFAVSVCVCVCVCVCMLVCVCVVWVWVFECISVPWQHQQWSSMLTQSTPLALGLVLYSL